MSNKHQAGVTLIELIVAMVIVAAAVAGLAAAFSSTASGSADPVIARQMVAIADGMMEEVLLHPYADDPSPSGPTRDNYLDIWDYDSARNPYRAKGIVNVLGEEVPGLDNYAVSVSVVPVALTGMTGNDAARVTVTVTYPGFPNVVLRGWRTSPGP